ncbi:MAG TPA: hypothetical protein VFA65_02105 [Bryobacteraceae bacterium]|nr:hypothetical protein [Bryobacteraceae bacterium]
MPFTTAQQFFGESGLVVLEMFLMECNDANGIRFAQEANWTFRGTRSDLRKRSLDTSMEITKGNAEAPLIS